MRFGWIIGVLLGAVPLNAQTAGTAALKPQPPLERKAAAGPMRVALVATADPLGSPLIGFAAQADGAGLYALQGFPGAAFPGPRLTLARAAGLPAISSAGSYAVARGAQPGELLVYGLRPNPGSGMLLPSAFFVNAQADRIVLSPLGGVALLYDRERREIEVVAGLPRQPHSLYTVSLAGLGGLLTALAVSDDGAVALAAFSNENGSGEIYRLQRDAASHTGTASRAAAAGRVVHMSFVPQTRDALVADYDRGQVLMLNDGGRQGTRTIAGRSDGVRAPVAVEASTNGSVFIVNEGSGTLVVAGSGTATPGLFSCGCVATGLERLKDPDSFRLTTGGGVQAVLQADQNQPGVFYVPAGEEAAQPSGAQTPSRIRK
ncbi:MAG: hypothetical protein WD733_13020 [Bryobacterales bacterium]